MQDSAVLLLPPAKKTAAEMVGAPSTQPELQPSGDGSRLTPILREGARAPCLAKDGRSYPGADRRLHKSN